MENNFTIERFDEIRKSGYRPGVVGVFLNNKRVLFFYKSDYKMWMLPQGGINNNESLPESLAREMSEEISSEFLSSCEPEFKVIHEDKITFAESMHGVKELETDAGTSIKMIGKFYFFCLLNCNIEESEIKSKEFDIPKWLNYKQAKYVNSLVYQQSKREMVDRLLNVLLVNKHLEN